MATSLKTLIKNTERLVNKSKKTHRDAIIRECKTIIKGLVSEMNTNFKGRSFESLIEAMETIREDEGAVWLEWESEETLPSFTSSTGLRPPFKIKNITWDGVVEENAAGDRFFTIVVDTATVHEPFIINGTLIES